MTTDSENAIAIFEGYKIRRHYDEENEVWYFSVIDILHVLLQNSDYQTTRNYWKVLKSHLKKEGSQSVTKCNQLKLPAADGKKYKTDVANPQTILRLIQSVPSPKASRIINDALKSKVIRLNEPDSAPKNRKDIPWWV